MNSKSKAQASDQPAPPRSFYYPHRRNATWYTGELVHPVTGEVYTPPARTKQSFVAECDINNILKQYKLTGQIRHISSKAAQGRYEDLPDPLDFQDAMNLVLMSEASFATLPSAVRARFGNDPSQFLGFMADPANAEEIVKLGLATKRPEAEPPAQAQAQAPASQAGPDKAPPSSGQTPPPKA